MRNWIVQFECKDGGHGWGEKGDVVSTGVKSPNISLAIDAAQYYMPYGWVVVSIKEAQA